LEEKIGNTEKQVNQRSKDKLETETTKAPIGPLKPEGGKSDFKKVRGEVEKTRGEEGSREGEVKGRHSQTGGRN